MKEFSVVLLTFLISSTSANNNSTKELIDGEILDTRCCYWHGEFVIFRDFKTFKIKDELKIESNDAEIMSKYKSVEIEKLEINSCANACTYCECNSNDSNIHNLPTKPNEVFPNLYAYVVKHTKVNCLNRRNFKDLKKLEYLTVEMSFVSKINDDAFDDLVELKTLSLAFNKIHILKPRVLKNNLKLKRVNFRGNRIEEISEEFFKHLTNLTFIDLSENKIKVLNTNVFENLVELVELKLYKNKITSLPVGIFGNLVKLEIINLISNKLTTLEDEIFENNKELREIWLWDNKISKINLKVFENKPKLAIVDLKSNVCVDQRFGYFGATQPFGQYEKFHLKKALNENCS